MKFCFCAVGKPHELYVKAGVEDFTGRIVHYYPAAWNVVQAAKQSGTFSESDQRKKEAAAILNLVKKEDYLIALDQQGKQLDSGGLARLIQSKANESVKQLVFLIGGAYGLDDMVLRRADFVWSLSNLVFPHQLVRLILAEQVYRACTIIRNEKYHHS